MGGDTRSDCKMEARQKVDNVRDQIVGEARIGNERIGI